MKTQGIIRNHMKFHGNHLKLHFCDIIRNDTKLYEF